MAVLLAICVLAPSSPFVGVTAPVALTALTIVTRFPLRRLGRRLRGIVWFVAAIVLINGLTVSGHVVGEWAGAYATREGVVRGLELSARIVLILWGASLFIHTTDIEEMVDAAEQWTRRRGSPLIAVTTVALLYMPLLVESGQRIKASRLSRGEEAKRGFLAGVTTAATAALPMFASALRSADALAEAIPAAAARKNDGPRNDPVRSEPARTRSVTMIRASAGPKAMRASSVEIFARPILRNGSGRGMYDSMTKRAVRTAARKPRRVTR